MGEPNTQRKYKERLFVSLFRKKEELLALYNAVNGSNYEDPDSLIINTIEDVIYLGMKNDVSFIFDARMNLYEHQSSWNPNMPLRGLFYFAMLYKGYIAMNGMDIYSERRLLLPTPQYVVFYNGTKSEPDKQTLRLSDYFQTDKGGAALECFATVVNINLGKNRELLEQCNTLYGYSYLVAEVQSNIEHVDMIVRYKSRLILRCISSPQWDHMHKTAKNYRRFICADAVFAISFFVPTPSKAISSKASPPILITERTIPLPNAVCCTMSPLFSSKYVAFEGAETTEDNSLFAAGL